MKQFKLKNKLAAGLLLFGFCAGLITVSNINVSAVANSSTSSAKDSALLILLQNTKPNSAEEVYGVLQSFGALNAKNKAQALNAIKNSYQNYVGKNPQNNIKNNIELYKKIELALLSEGNLLTSSFTSAEKLKMINKEKEEALVKQKAILKDKKEQEAQTAKIRTQALQAVQAQKDNKKPSVLASPEEIKFINALDKVALDTYKIYEALEIKKVLKQDKLSPEETKKRKETIKQVISNAIKPAQEKREKALSPATIKAIQEGLTQRGLVN